MDSDVWAQERALIVEGALSCGGLVLAIEIDGVRVRAFYPSNFTMGNTLQTLEAYFSHLFEWSGSDYTREGRSRLRALERRLTRELRALRAVLVSQRDSRLKEQGYEKPFCLGLVQDLEALGSASSTRHR